MKMNPFGPKQRISSKIYGLPLFILRVIPSILHRKKDKQTTISETYIKKSNSKNGKNGSWPVFNSTQHHTKVSTVQNWKF
jgi:hypothetical protein